MFLFLDFKILLTFVSDHKLCALIMYLFNDFVICQFRNSEYLFEWMQITRKKCEIEPNKNNRLPEVNQKQLWTSFTHFSHHVLFTSMNVVLDWVRISSRLGAICTRIYFTFVNPTKSHITSRNESRQIGLRNEKLSRLFLSYDPKLTAQ